MLFAAEPKFPVTCVGGWDFVSSCHNSLTTSTAAPAFTLKEVSLDPLGGGQGSFVAPLIAVESAFVAPLILAHWRGYKPAILATKMLASTSFCAYAYTQ